MRLLFLVIALIPLSNIQAARCLWVSSYASGYAWEDGIGRGIHSVLDGKCEIKKFHMNTKVHRSQEFGQQQAKLAKQLIENYKPDVVIASDDNVSKYLVTPYYKNSHIPFVFCGINWTAEEYDYPFKNTTGIIEVDPVQPLIETIKSDWTIKFGTIFILNANTNSGTISIK